MVGFDVPTSRVVASVVIHAPVLRPDRPLNALRIDLTHGAQGTGYVTNLPFGSMLSVPVLDGAQRARLQRAGRGCSRQPLGAFEQQRVVQRRPDGVVRAPCP